MKARRLRMVIIVFGLFLLTLSGGLLVFQDAHRSAEQHRTVTKVLGDAKDLDRVLDEDILLIRSFLISNYDSLVWATDTMTKLCAEAELPGGLWSSDPESFAKTGPEYCNAVRKKIDLVEEFKSNNSVLRNARAFIPTLIDQFQGTPFDERSDHLMIFVFRYFLEQTPANRAAVARNLKWTSIAEKNPHFSEISRSLRSSVEGLLKAVEIRNRIEDEIFSGSVRVRFTKLEAVYMEKHAWEEIRSTRYRIALLLLCSALAGSMVLIVYRLNLTSYLLADLNQTLEEKVEERTKELQDTSDRLSEGQQILSQSTKMSALGEMAGGIAHEINTPLAAILLSAESLRRQAESGEVGNTLDALNGIVKTVQRISKIVVGLRRFSRDSSAEKPKPVAVASVIDDTLTLCREKFRKHSIPLIVETDDEFAHVECVPEQVSQVLMNLLSNSFDAVSDLPEKWIRITCSRVPEGYEIAVLDSGRGIPEAISAKIMQPFFTTKEIGKGTGLGLSISKGLLEAQNGSLHYDPTSARTRFVIRLREYDEYRVA